MVVSVGYNGLCLFARGCLKLWRGLLYLKGTRETTKRMPFKELF